MRLRKFFWACAGIMVFASMASAADGAIAATNARSQAGANAAANLGGGGPGVDLRAIASPNKRPQTFTGFPAGTLPGDGAGGGSQGADPGGQNAVMQGAGDSLAPIIGSSLTGMTLDRVCSVAAHVGYTVVKRSYTPNSLDSAYTIDVMNGRSKKATLYLDRGMRVLRVIN